MLHMKLTRTFFIVVAAGFLACRGEPQSEADAAPIMTFDTSHVRIVSKSDTIPLIVELARTNAERTMGLMERTRLADSAGMLFIYEGMQPANAGFWMFRTRIPLDIAFVDSLGVIRSIRNMVPCTTATAANCPTYEPGVPYRAALEVTAGFFQNRKVGLGDRVMLADTLRKK
jgi:uncharacterized membrane protein (UPF0127 family)